MGADVEQPVVDAWNELGTKCMQGLEFKWSGALEG